MVICDPSYCEPARTRVVGHVIRAICILGAPIPDTNDTQSCQIIIPQKQLKRRNDVFITMVSWAHCVAAANKYIAIVSTVCETQNPEAEIQPGIAILGKVEEKFVQITELRIPLEDGVRDQVFVTASYDPTSHFEQASLEVLDMWRRIAGTELDLTVLPSEDDM